MIDDDLMERRKLRRILAVCRVLDLQENFLGFTLDLTLEGILIIIPNTFPPETEFELILKQPSERQGKPNLKVKIQQIWRKAKNEDFDEIGGKLMGVSDDGGLKDLVNYCDHVAKKKYDLDMYVAFPD